MKKRNDFSMSCEFTKRKENRVYSGVIRRRKSEFVERTKQKKTTITDAIEIALNAILLLIYNTSCLKVSNKDSVKMYSFFSTLGPSRSMSMMVVTYAERDHK